MALSSSQILSFSQAIVGISTPEVAVETLLTLLDKEGISPVSWNSVSECFVTAYRITSTREYGKVFDKIMKPSGQRGYYVRKDSSPSALPPRAPRASRSEGLSWAPSFLAPDQERESWYGEDAGLRRLALGQVKCFASFSESDRACGSCPLARFCQEASFSKMDELARLMDSQEEARILQETEALNAPPAPPAPPAPVTPDGVAPAPAPVAPASPSGNVLEILADLQSRGMTASSPPMPFKGVCSGCFGTVEAGSTVIHVKGRGMYHPVCAGVI